MVNNYYQPPWLCLSVNYSNAYFVGNRTIIVMRYAPQMKIN